VSCTHCGQCLESCPTYTLWGTEADSPRGRITLIEQGLAPEGVVGAAMIEHVDSCLGCMACMTACPEDVDYPSLLSAAREAINEQADRPMRTRVARRMALDAIPLAGRATRLTGRGVPQFTAAHGEMRGRAGLLVGCRHRAPQGAVHNATVKVLAAEGYEVIAPRGLDCCGAPHLHSGEIAQAEHHARNVIDRFAAVGGVDHVITDGGRCGVSLKAYGRLLDTVQARAFSSLVKDVHELLVQAPLRSALAPLALRVALHDACQLRHGQRLPDSGRALLAQVPGLELIELDSQAGACCGAPGIYRLTQREAAAELGERQARAIVATGAEILVTGDAACGEQLAERVRRLGHRIDVRHPVELVARSIQAAHAA